MKKSLSVLITSILCLFGASCTNEPGEQDPSIKDINIEIAISDISFNSADVEYTPSDAEVTYYHSVLPKSEYDKFATSNEIKAADLVNLKKTAEDNGVGLESVIAGELRKGITSEEVRNLLPETSYVVYAYALNTKGEVSASISAKEFTTTEEVLESKMVTVEILESTMTKVKFKSSPANDEIRYYPDIITQENFELYGGTKEGLMEYFKVTLAATAQVQELTISETVARICKSGEFTKTYDYLNPEQYYYCFAAVLDTEGNILDFQYETALTEDRQLVDFTIDCSLTTIDQRTLKLDISVSNQEQNYWYAVFDSQMFARCETDEEMMQLIIDEFGASLENDLLTGDVDGSIHNLAPGIEYTLVAFAYDKTYVSGLGKSSASTKDRVAPEDLQVKITIAGTTSIAVDAIFEPEDPLAQFHFYYFTEDFLNSCDDLNDAVQKNFDIYLSQWQDMYPELSVQEIIQKIGRNGSRQYKPNLLVPSTKYYMWAACFDINGKLLSDNPSAATFTTETYIEDESKTVVPVADKYFDGWVLAREYNWKMYAEQILFVIDTVEVKNADKWFTAVFVGDIMSEEDFPDYQIAGNLINKGQENWGEVPRFTLSKTWGPRTVCGMAIGEDGEFGPVHRHLVVTSEETATDPEIFFEIFPDGMNPTSAPSLTPLKPQYAEFEVLNKLDIENIDIELIK